MPPELAITQQKIEKELSDQIPDGDLEFTTEDDLKLRKDALMRHQEDLIETLDTLEGQLSTFGAMLPEKETALLKDDIVKAKVFIGTNNAEMKKIDEKIASLQKQPVVEVPTHLEMPTTELGRWKQELPLIKQQIADMRAVGITYSNELFELEGRRDELTEKIQKTEEEVKA